MVHWWYPINYCSARLLVLMQSIGRGYQVPVWAFSWWINAYWIIWTLLKLYTVHTCNERNDSNDDIGLTYVPLITDSNKWTFSSDCVTDWAVVHSRNITFYSWSNTSLERHVRHMQVPAPKYPTSVYVANSSLTDFNLGTIHGFAKEYLDDAVAGEPYIDRLWSSRELFQIAADRRRNLVYLLAKSKDQQPAVSSIVMFNLTSGNSYVVLQSK